MASELSESVRSQTVILCKEELSQRQITARLHGSFVSKAQLKRPKGPRLPEDNQYIQLCLFILYQRYKII